MIQKVQTSHMFVGTCLLDLVSRQSHNESSTRVYTLYVPLNRGLSPINSFYQVSLIRGWGRYLGFKTVFHRRGSPNVKGGVKCRSFLVH